MGNFLETDRLTLLECAHTRKSVVGPLQCVCVNAWRKGDICPSLLMASVLLVSTRNGWVLSHILIADEARCEGFATELVRFYELRLGGLGACWASEAGAAFAIGRSTPGG